MSEDIHFFHRIPYETYAHKHDNPASNLSLNDLENGMVVEALSTNRYLKREGAAVSFTAELELNTPISSKLGSIGMNLLIRSHSTLEPIPGSKYPVEVFPQGGEHAPLLWRMRGQFPLRTARYGVIEAGFFTYWADSLIDEITSGDRPAKE